MAASVQRDLDVGLIARTGARAEQWRYQVESAVRARASALAAGDGRDLDDPRRNFEEVDKRMTHPFSSWSIAVRGRWALPEDIFRTEGRAAVLAMCHALRRSDQYGKHTLVLVDNLGLALSLGKGRCATTAGINTCRERLALSIMGNTQFVIRWVCSEYNPADGPSRLTGMAVDFERADLRQADWNHEAAEAAAEARRRPAGQQLDEAIAAQAARWINDEPDLQAGRSDPAGHHGEAWAHTERRARSPMDQVSPGCTAGQT